MLSILRSKALHVDVEAARERGTTWKPHQPRSGCSGAQLLQRDCHGSAELKRESVSTLAMELPAPVIQEFWSFQAPAYQHSQISCFQLAQAAYPASIVTVQGASRLFQLLSPQPASLRQQSQTTQPYELGLVGIDTLLLSTQRPDRQAGLRLSKVPAGSCSDMAGLGLGSASAKRLAPLPSQLLRSPGAQVDPSSSSTACSKTPAQHQSRPPSDCDLCTSPPPPQ